VKDKDGKLIGFEELNFIPEQNREEEIKIPVEVIKRGIGLFSEENMKNRDSKPKEFPKEMK